MFCCRFEWFFFDAVDGVVKKPEFTPDPKKPVPNSAEKNSLKGVTKKRSDEDVDGGVGGLGQPERFVQDPMTSTQKHKHF